MKTTTAIRMDWLGREAIADAPEAPEAPAEAEIPADAAEAAAQAGEEVSNEQ